VYRVSGLVAFIRKTLQHRNSPMRLGKPVRCSSEGDEGRQA
jgi:hypothetical protein